jgi:hypothetical protein
MFGFGMTLACFALVGILAIGNLIPPSKKVEEHNRELLSKPLTQLSKFERGERFNIIFSEYATLAGWVAFFVGVAIALLSFFIS